MTESAMEELRYPVGRFRPRPDLAELDLDTQLQLFDWHGRHHLAHVTRLVERKGWA